MQKTAVDVAFDFLLHHPLIMGCAIMLAGLILAFIVEAVYHAVVSAVKRRHDR